MAKTFNIGDRVKRINSTNGVIPVGTTGTITGYNDVVGSYGYKCHVVDWDYTGHYDPNYKFSDPCNLELIAAAGIAAGTPISIMGFDKAYSESCAIKGTITPSHCHRCGNKNEYGAPANRGNNFVCGQCRAFS